MVSKLLDILCGFGPFCVVGEPKVLLLLLSECCVAGAIVGDVPNEVGSDVTVWGVWSPVDGPNEGVGSMVDESKEGVGSIINVPIE